MRIKCLFLIALFICPINQSIADDPPSQKPVSDLLIRSLKHPDAKSALRIVQFTHDGKLFAAGYPSGVIQLFEISSGRELKSIETGFGYRGTADYAFPTPDFRTVFVTQEKALPAGDGRPKPILIGEVEIWDLKEQKKVDVIPTMTPQVGVRAGYLSPNGQTLITVENANVRDNNIEPTSTVLWDVKTKKSKWLTFGYSMAAFTPDSQKVAVTVFGSDKSHGRLDWIDLQTGAVKWSVDAEYPQRGFSWPVISRDGSKIALLDSEGRIDRPSTLKIIDAANGKLIKKIDSSKTNPFMGPEFSPDGLLVAVNSYEGDFLLWDFAKNVSIIEKQFPKQSLGYKASFSPNGKKIAICANQKDISEDMNPFPQPTIHVWDISKPAEPRSITAPPGYCGALMWSPDSKKLAFGSAGAVHLFDMTR